MISPTVTMSRRAAHLAVAALLLLGALALVAAPAADAQEGLCPRAAGDLELRGAPTVEADSDNNILLTCNYRSADESVSRVRLNLIWTQNDTQTEDPADCQFQDTDPTEENNRLQGRYFSQTKAANSRYTVLDTTLTYDLESVQAAARELLAAGEPRAIDCDALPTGETTTTTAAPGTTTTLPTGETTTTAGGTPGETTTTTLVAGDVDDGGSSGAVQALVIGLVIAVVAGFGGYVWYQRSRRPGGGPGGGPMNPPARPTG